MKTSSLMFLLALILTLTFLLPGRNAQASPPSASFVTSAPGSSSAYAECLADCLREHQEFLRNAKRACKNCTLWIFGLCVASTTDTNCIDSNKAKADEVYEACKKGCEKPKP